jgi:hypothetical protein
MPALSAISPAVAPRCSRSSRTFWPSTSTYILSHSWFLPSLGIRGGARVRCMGYRAGAIGRSVGSGYKGKP